MDRAKLPDFINAVLRAGGKLDLNDPTVIHMPKGTYGLTFRGDRVDVLWVPTEAD